MAIFATRLATTTEGEQKAKIRNPATTEGEQKAKIREPAADASCQERTCSRCILREVKTREPAVGILITRITRLATTTEG